MEETHMSQGIIKKGRALQRFYFTVTSGIGAADLTGKTIEAKLAKTDSTSPQAITAVLASPQVGTDLGRGYIEITLANLTALANPDQALMVTTIWNADGSRFRSARGVMDIIL
jgi:hypothetical protein